MSNEAEVGVYTGHERVDDGVKIEGLTDAKIEVSTDDVNVKPGEWRAPPTHEELVMGMHTSVLHEFIARMCHDVNRVYSSSINDNLESCLWDDLDKAEQQSVIGGVRYVAQHNGELTPKMMHDEWVNDKRRRGWVYGAAKNYKNKTHPNLMPYNQIHKTQQAKDEMFLTICQSFFTRSL